MNQIIIKKKQYMQCSECNCSYESCPCKIDSSTCIYERKYDEDMQDDDLNEKIKK